jgi:HEAT repeat protein
LIHVIHIVGADGRLQYEYESEKASPKLAQVAVLKAFDGRLEEQRRILALLERAKAGDGRAQKDLLRASRPQKPHQKSPALAVWGMGETGLKTFLPPLRALRAAQPKMVSDFPLAVAKALLQLGDTSGVNLLLEALEDPGSSAYRETAYEALNRTFGDEDPPLPKVRTYAPDPYRSEDVERVRTWWKAR